MILFIFSLGLASQTNQKTSFPNYKNKNGEWRELHISIEENSGSVAPEFRYSLMTSIEATKDGLFISRVETKADAQILKNRSRISEEDYEAVMTKLFELGIDSLENEILPAEKLLGVNYNTIDFRLGKIKKRYYYLLQDLGKEKRNQKNEIIEIMRGIKP
ncbi:MAG: hypothetical protein O9264_05735 [Leptospira sp.]|nr:hypothetical protein [Leptospira sp.]